MAPIRLIMNTGNTPDWLLIAFPFLFIAFWCAICILLSFVGGWRRLASQFSVSTAPAGKKFLIQSARIGWVGYNNCLTITTSDAGISLAMWKICRPGHPTLFIPWEGMANAKERRVFWFDMVEFSAGTPAGVKILLPKRVFNGHLPPPN